MMNTLKQQRAILLVMAVLSFCAALTLWITLYRETQESRAWQLKVYQLQDQVVDLLEFINSPDFIEIELKEVETTGYAPLDPKAVEGMCYSGDPNITASGNFTTPGLTIAASPEIPFGTWVFLEGLGWRRVDDRGGKIKENQIDICFATQEEALSWGRKKIVMAIPSWK